jgi:thiol-disulfide isomerase/thioredoxin
MNTVPPDEDRSESELVSAPEPRYSRRTVAAALIMAAGLVGGTWYIGERKGYSSIGSGGVNAKLLPKIGEPAPNLVAMRSADELLFLSDYLGQPVWLNFWGSWCPPCREEMPDMEAAYLRLAPRGLVILAISLDEPMEAAFDYAALVGASYTIASDPVRKGTGGNYAIANFPTHILSDREGIIRDIVLAALTEEQIIEHAEKIL